MDCLLVSLHSSVPASCLEIVRGIGVSENTSLDLAISSLECGMGLEPFHRLSTTRVIERPDLPRDLREFYSRHEGIGLKSDPYKAVRIASLDELKHVGWKDLGLVGDSPEHWEDFAAIQIGLGPYFDKVVYVVNAPSCPPGSILALGSNLCGPGGEGPHALESSLVLATSLSNWLSHLKRMGWEEPAIGSFGDLIEERQAEVRRYYHALNPGLHTNTA